jgi:hypothetical protein
LTFRRAQVETISTISTISNSRNDLILVSYILWITKVSIGPIHYKQDYLRKIPRLFNQYFQDFSLLFSYQFPFFHFSIPSLFPKRLFMLDGHIWKLDNNNKKRHNKESKSGFECIFTQYHKGAIHSAYI